MIYNYIVSLHSLCEFIIEDVHTSLGLMILFSLHSLCEFIIEDVHTSTVYVFTIEISASMRLSGSRPGSGSSPIPCTWHPGPSLSEWGLL